jgi:phage shock protein PspC (stress-responsive transcriptional regulator)
MTDEPAEPRGPASHTPPVTGGATGARAADVHADATAVEPGQDPATTPTTQASPTDAPRADVTAEIPTAALPADTSAAEPTVALPTDATTALPAACTATLDADTTTKLGRDATADVRPGAGDETAAIPVGAPSEPGGMTAEQPAGMSGPDAPSPGPAAGASGFGPPTGPPPAGDAGFPPPPPPPPPPGGPNWSQYFSPLSRHTMVRPRDGRYVAGVCAALGRATGTDPVLWRVVLTVLGFFGGTGVLLYLAGWLLIPAEGDTASPLESVLGKGRSSTSPWHVVMLGIGAVITLMIIVNGGFRAAVLGAAIVVGAILLVKRNGGFPAAPPAPAAATPPGPAGFAAPEPPPAPFTPPAPFAPAATTATTWPGAPGTGTPGAEMAGAATTDATATGATATAPPFAAAAAAAAGSFPPPPFAATAGAGSFAPPPPPAGYRAPFAPHGPFAGPAVAPPPAPKPPKPPKEKSRLGRLTVSMALVVIAVMTFVDLALPVSIPVPAYVAGALATVGAGLVLGAWFGRSRGLIALGIVLVVALAATNAATSVSGFGGSQDWRPESLGELASSYRYDVGDASLDLRGLDFAGLDRTVAVDMQAGTLRVLLPRNVDANIHVEMDAGSANVFGNAWEGIDVERRTITDYGSDGPGGGTLTFQVSMNIGELEVTR